MITKLKLTLFVIFLLTVLFSYGQNNEKISDVHTDIDCYYKVEELSTNCRLLNAEIALLTADTVDWKAKYDRQVKTGDSVAFENNILQSQVKNVVANCQKSLDRKSTWEAIFKYVALVAVPVAVVSTGLLILK